MAGSRVSGDQPGIDPAHVETIIADLRRSYDQLRTTPPSSTPSDRPGVHGWSMRLTVEEVGVLLALHDEVIELRRQSVGDFETGFTPVAVESVTRFNDYVMSATCAVCGLGIQQGVVSAKWFHVGEVPDARDPAHRATPAVPTSAETCPRRGTHHDCPLGGCPTGREERETPPDLPASCRWCGLRIEFYLDAWHHDGNLDADPRTPIHPAEPIELLRTTPPDLPACGYLVSAANGLAVARCTLADGHDGAHDLEQTRETPPDLPKPIAGSAYACCEHCSDPMRVGSGLVGKPHLHLIPCTACGQPA